jgi:hypothetical protein
MCTGRAAPAPQVFPLQDLQHPRALQGLRDRHRRQGTVRPPVVVALAKNIKPKGTVSPSDFG